MNKYIINASELSYNPFPGEIPEALKEKFEGARIGQAAQMILSRKLGYNITVLPPGKRAYPFHAHQVNEEMFYIIKGSGEVRIGSETFPIKEGDMIAAAPGGADVAHQIINTSSEELQYLAVSTKESPEIVEYPDSGKFGAASETFRFIGRKGESLKYWDGE